MPKSLKIFLYAAAGLIGLLVILAANAGRFIDVNALRPRLEAAAARASGMQVQIEGDLHIDFFPGISLTLNRVQVRNRGIPLAKAEQAKLRIELVSVLKNRPRVQSVAITRATLSIERDRQGVFNFEKTDKPKGVPRTLDLTSLSVKDGAILYLDKQSGRKIEGADCSVEASHLRLSGVSGVELMKNIDVNAKLACIRVHSEKIALANLTATVQGAKGHYHVRHASMQVFGGQGTAEAKADFSSEPPHWQAHYRLNRFRVEKLLEILQPKYAVKGALDFSAQLSANGKTWKSLQETASGEVSLRGEDLSLEGRDLDLELARYDSTQNFNLIDVGALFFAGPVGIAVTKGYDFSKLFRGKGGTTSIQEMVSQWRVEHGVAEAEDVAIATRENYLAVQGGLDFANKRFEHLTVALVDTRGCTRIRQKIRGPFRKPVVEKPNIIQAVTAPVRKLLKKAKEVLTGPRCELFYRGVLLEPNPPEGAPSG